MELASRFDVCHPCPVCYARYGVIPAPLFFEPKSHPQARVVAGHNFELALAGESRLGSRENGFKLSSAGGLLKPAGGARYQVGQIATVEVKGEWQFSFRPIRAVHCRNGTFWYLFEGVGTGYRESDVVLATQAGERYTGSLCWPVEDGPCANINSAESERGGRLEQEAHVERLRARLAELEVQLGERDVRIEALQQQVQRLEEQLAEAQRAGKRQATPFARKKRQARPKRPGRKAGQGKFNHRPKPAPEDVNRTLEVPLPSCPECGGGLKDEKTHEHFEVDIPPVRPIVTRYVTHSGYCKTCHKRVRSRHPEQISNAVGAAGVVIGPRAKAIAADLKHRLGVPYAKICDHLETAMGLPVTPGALSQADTRLAKKARPVYEALVAALRACTLAHSDETGWRIGILAAWLWVFTNQDITVYTIRQSRGHEVVLDILGQEFKGVLVSDCFLAYDAKALADWLKQKCVGHLLRNLSEIEASKTGRAVCFARDVTALLREALALKADKPTLEADTFAQQASALETRLDVLIDEKRRMTDPDNVRFAKRLRKQRPHLLRFLYVDELDATNNIAERRLRPPIVTRKTSGCNRTEGGAEAHAILSSVLVTCRQQKQPILDYLVELQRAPGEPPPLLPKSMRAPSTPGPP
jgi:transposase